MVWVVDETGTVNLHPIGVSRVMGDKWLVTSGLKVGNKVVVAGLQKIHPMSKVTIVEMLP